jgi:hypothetical protein
MRPPACRRLVDGYVFYVFRLVDGGQAKRMYLLIVLDELKMGNSSLVMFFFPWYFRRVFLFWRGMSVA